MSHYTHLTIEEREKASLLLTPKSNISKKSCHSNKKRVKNLSNFRQNMLSKVGNCVIIQNK
jgi:lipoate-protein ligase A